jgi:hypothetical protein
LAHDVFVSYAKEDKATADALVATLEQHQIRCWIAPRDVLPGQDYAEMLIEAIGDAQVMVLVFSANANDSPHVMTEVERAASKGIAILPLRIEDVAPSKSMEYFISKTHWLDALTPPLEEHLQQLAETVRLLLARAGRAAPAGEEPELVVERKIEQSGAASWLSSFWKWTTGGSKWRLAAVIGGPLIVLFFVIAVILDDAREEPEDYVSIVAPEILDFQNQLEIVLDSIQDPNFDDPAWRLDVANAAHEMKDSIEKMRELNPPECLQPFHNQLASSLEDFDESADLYIRGVQTSSQEDLVSGYEAGWPGINKMYAATGGGRASDLTAFLLSQC